MQKLPLNTQGVYPTLQDIGAWSCRFSTKTGQKETLVQVEEAHNPLLTW